MPDNFIGEIAMFAFGLEPEGWIPCDGRELRIDDYPDLHMVLQNQFGGGIDTFRVPDLRGRVGVHDPQGQNDWLGSEFVTLDARQIPPHTHETRAIENAGDTPNPTLNFFAGTAFNMYGAPAQNPPSLAWEAVTEAGGGQPHENRQPYLAVNYFISLHGEYPPQP